MATRYSSNNDHYVKQPERETLRRIMREEGITMVTMAYELRMQRTHISGMLGGSKKMAMVHKLAMQFVILKHRQARLQNLREELMESGNN